MIIVHVINKDISAVLFLCIALYTIIDKSRELLRSKQVNSPVSSRSIAGNVPHLPPPRKTLTARIMQKSTTLAFLQKVAMPIPWRSPVSWVLRFNGFVCSMIILFLSGLSGSWVCPSLYLSAPWGAEKLTSSRSHIKSLNEASSCSDWVCSPAIVSNSFSSLMKIIPSFTWNILGLEKYHYIGNNLTRTCAATRVEFTLVGQRQPIKKTGVKMSLPYFHGKIERVFAYSLVYICLWNVCDVVVVTLWDISPIYENMCRNHSLPQGLAIAGDRHRSHLEKYSYHGPAGTKCNCSVLVRYSNFIYFLDGNLEFYRIPGVLQRFGICYLFVAMMQLLLSPMDNRERKVTNSHMYAC